MGSRCDETKMLSGPTSAKKPILFTFVTSASITSPLNWVSGATYRFQDDRLVFAAELGEARSRHHLALSDIHDRHDLDDITLRERRDVRISRYTCPRRRP